MAIFGVEIMMAQMKTQAMVLMMRGNAKTRPHDFHCRFQIVFIYICILSASGSGDCCCCYCYCYVYCWLLLHASLHAHFSAVNGQRKGKKLLASVECEQQQQQQTNSTWKSGRCVGEIQALKSKTVRTVRKGSVQLALAKSSSVCVYWTQYVSITAWL